MADGPWRTSAGVAAVLVWSAVVGVPILAYHVRGYGLFFGDHLHAALLFVTSQFLVFYLAARPGRKRRPEPVAVGRPIPAKPVEPEIWNAELAPSPDYLVPASEQVIAKSQPAGAICISKVVISNYLGSSHPRIVYVEPGGAHYKLLPGQELEIIATTIGFPATFRVVESDLATQVHMLGSGITVSASLNQRRLIRECPTQL